MRLGVILPGFLFFVLLNATAWGQALLSPGRLVEPARGLFLSNMQVDDDDSKECVDPAIILDTKDDLLLVYAEKFSHFNPDHIMFTCSGDGGMTWRMPATVGTNWPWCRIGMITSGS